MKQNIVITGVSSGIGESFVRMALSTGKFEVIGLGRKNIEKAIPTEGYTFISTDLANESSIQNAIELILRKIGTVDILINNAGFGYKGTVSEISLDEIHEQFDVNFFGTLSLTQKVLHVMKKQLNGHIINISSIGAILSTPTLGYYAASKVALDKISEVLAQEVRKYNIHVSNISPGTVKTRFGKNIKTTKNIGTEGDQSTYEEWDIRFRNFFKKHNTADDVARLILRVIEKPRMYSYLSFRDKMIVLSRFLPLRLQQFILYNLFLTK